MTARPLGVQIAHMLKSRGVEVVFGIPGVHNQELYRGLAEAGLRHVLPRHEQGAGFMADGYARATGMPGVCVVISGPGLTNILTPMGQAYSDSVPMLVISSCLHETAARRGQLHQMRDQEGAARTVADWSETARTPEAAYRLIDRALTEFTASRPRPKHLSLPIPALGEPAPPFPSGGGVEGLLPQAWEGNISAMAHALRGARRPLFLFGGGARRIDFAGPVLMRWRAASVTTYAGRGVVPPETPLFLGACLARPTSIDLIASADLVIALGTELAETDLWRDRLGHQGCLFRVDLDPAVLATPGEIPVPGDCFGVFDDLATAVPEALKTNWSPAEIAKARAAWRAEVDAERPGIVSICDALRSVLPETTRIYSDMTQFAYTAKDVWDMPAPGLWHHPFGFGTLGYALPAAIGGKIGLPDDPVIAIAGDYGFQYTVQELATAVELGLPLPILLWDNGKLGEIEASMARAQIAPTAVTLKNPDFLALARAYGAQAVEPQSLPDLQAAVLDALQADGPTLIRMTPELGR